MKIVEAQMGSEQVGADAAQAFLEYFRCPRAFAPFRVMRSSPGGEGFFRFGSAVCFGKIFAAEWAEAPDRTLFDALSATEASTGHEVGLLFNPTEVIENLRRERYLVSSRGERRLRSLYYLIRPILPFPIRKVLHRYVSRKRCGSVLPAWPVDCSVEQIFQSLMELAIPATGEPEIPFIWFWPEGKRCAAMMTHDVEEEIGVAHCDVLMDLDDSFSVKASFQIIPEGRYEGAEALITHIRSRGFEANVHDLDHDGRLYEHQELFRQRSQKINHYARKYQMEGFRAGSMHRNQEWFDLLEFQYDMSVPTVAHMEPQSGGCCTVTPYFVGDVLELPLTTVQDHSLFYILGEHSIDLWRKQIEIISAHHGLISFIVHPDYIVKATERRMYCQLLQHLSDMREEHDTWFALPQEINRWWRQRREMRLVRTPDGWQISGLGSERARLAYARIVDGKLAYRIVGGSPSSSTESASARNSDLSAEHVDCG